MSEWVINKTRSELFQVNDDSFALPVSFDKIRSSGIARWRGSFHVRSRARTCSVLRNRVFTREGESKERLCSWSESQMRIYFITDHFRGSSLVFWLADFMVFDFDLRVCFSEKRTFLLRYTSSKRHPTERAKKMKERILTQLIASALASEKNGNRGNK